MINNVVLTSDVQESDSVMHIHVSMVFQILFPFRLLQNIELCSLCYIVGPCRLSVLNIIVCICREGNGSPLQYFCLENPMDGGAC